MPGEDPAALQERLDDWTVDLQPRNSVEQNLVGRGVRLSWQLDRWAELGTLVECELAWLSPDILKAIRLLGMQPIDAIDDLDVARIFLACFVIRGSTGDPFHEIIYELFTREEVVFRQQVAARQLTAFMPKDAADARAVLAAIVAHARGRLTAQLEKHLRRDNEIKALGTRRTCPARPTTPVLSIRTERPNALHKSLSNSKIDPSATDVGNFVHCVTLHVLPSSWPPARD
jgi:hypothetical protein